MIDIENAAPNIQNLKDEGKEWDATQHHVRQIADNGHKKQLRLATMFSDLFLGLGFYPSFKGS